MKFETFSRLEEHYIKQYNYWTDKLDENNSLVRHQQIEKKIMYYDKQLERLHREADSLTYQ